MKASVKPDETLIARFTAIVGDKYALTDAADIAPFVAEQRGLYGGQTGLVLRPGSVAEVSAILKLASETATAIVPQGGNTGLVGGQMPDQSGSQVVVSLARLNRIREVDLKANTVTVDAGVVLQVLQEEAAKHDRLMPLALASQGSCQIGGNLSSNAGGVGALAYGTARDLCLGVEVVLPTGEIFDDLRKLKKDNTGYDLKDLFIGAEGTLGIITGAVIKLYPAPKGRELAWIAVESPVAALALFEKANDFAGSSLTMFELMQDRALQFVLQHIPGSQAPLENPTTWHVLMEISSGRSSQDASELMAEILSEGFEAELLSDAVIAQNDTQRLRLLNLRENMSEAQKPEGGSIKHDISVPISRVPEFISLAGVAVDAVVPGARVVCFGHMGDGNLHYNVSQPVGMSKDDYLSHYGAMNEVVYAIVAQMKGSFSAEHGIGSLKREQLAATQADIATDLMRRIKAAFDPAGIMNPGKVL